MRGLLLGCVIGLLTWSGPGLAGSIYVKIDEQGRKVYTNYTHRTRRSPSPYRKVSLEPRKYRPYIDRIRELGRRYRVDTNLILALIAVESDFRHRAVSRAGAIGLMQLMPSVADRYGVDPWKPDENLEGGVRHLAYLLRKYRDLTLALAAYNAGEQAVDRYQGVPPYRETRNYVKMILKLYQSHPSVAYRYTDAAGVVYYSYTKPPDGTYTTLKRIELDR